MIGPSDMYGDLESEDVDEFEGLQPDDEHEIDPYGKFWRGEVHTFEEDFEEELDRIKDDPFPVEETELFTYYEELNSNTREVE
jgi:hypothetical protein